MQRPQTRAQRLAVSMGRDLILGDPILNFNSASENAAFSNRECGCESIPFTVNVNVQRLIGGVTSASGSAIGRWRAHHFRGAKSRAHRRLPKHEYALCIRGATHVVREHVPDGAVASRIARAMRTHTLIQRFDNSSVNRGSPRFTPLICCLVQL